MLLVGFEPTYAILEIAALTIELQKRYVIYVSVGLTINICFGQKRQGTLRGRHRTGEFELLAVRHIQ